MDAKHKHLEELALDAFNDRIGWVAFWRANAETIRKAEPHDIRRYRRLTDTLMAIVISGNADGHHPIGDDVDDWDDAPDAYLQPGLFDNSPPYE
jgi:hypothetical protein